MQRRKHYPLVTNGERIDTDKSIFDYSANKEEVIGSVSLSDYALANNESLEKVETRDSRGGGNLALD
ncbi:hypothetical protein ABEY41_21030 [Peribacillus butanolivorans]|uniref:hypothetical protein n=1 Tax=Peribacillus butanolivorans TaxID=421767 RepID=UPI003D2C375B